FVLPIFVLFGLALPWGEWAELGWSGPILVGAVLLLRRLPAVVALNPLLARSRGGLHAPRASAPRSSSLLVPYGPAAPAPRRRPAGTGEEGGTPIRKHPKYRKGKRRPHGEFGRASSGQSALGKVPRTRG
ncbi:MAG: hypothetical protein M3P49_02195, partial [Actinomycetota bacterium]|nr:hypothetical protein [Actinomycetota bacterium]